MNDLVAIDPAALRFAYAVFEGGVLVAAGYAEHPHQIPLRSGVRYRWILESPRRYTGFGVAHKDLDRLDAKLAQIRALIRGRGEDVTSRAPSDWKGNVPKQVHHARLWAQYSAQEQQILLAPPGAPGYMHDMHDAAALGCTALRRVRRGGLR
jgi:hypothetical protein